MDEQQEVLQDFLAVSTKSLTQLDRDIVELEKRPADRALLWNIFRTISAIKCASSFLGFTTLEAITHGAETILIQLRHGERILARGLTLLLLETAASVKQILVQIESTSREGDEQYTELRERLEQACSGADQAEVCQSGEAPAEPSDPEPTSPQATWAEEQSRSEEAEVPESDEALRESLWNAESAVDINAAEDETTRQFIAIAAEVVRVAGNEDAGTEDLAEVISLDPAMSAKLLHVANSAAFGRPYEIVTLRRACAQIGFHATKYWVLTFAVVSILGRPKVEGFDYQGFWKSSVLRAVSAKLFASHAIPKLADDAFTLGLLSGIGQLALASSRPADYRAVWEAGGRTTWPSETVQRQVLGYCTHDLGTALLSSWGLPAVVYEAHHALRQGIPEDCPPQSRQLARVLALAWCCDRLMHGEDKAQTLTELYEAAWEAFGISSESVDKLLGSVDRHVRDVCDILQIPVGDLSMETALYEGQFGLSGDANLACPTS